MKNWLKGAGTVLSNVAEVVAPTPKSPLESFKRHWNAIRNFYIDQKNDVDSGNIPLHLHSIVQILLEEDDERPLTEGAGPCLEFFMHNKIMETLCALCLVDKPTGVRRLILSAVNSILGNMKKMLIPHVTIHNPLSNLISGMATMQLGAELVDALTLIKTCLGIIASDHTLGEFFITVPPEGKVNAEFSVWTALASLFKRTSPEQRNRIEDLILMTINCANPRVMELIMMTDFHNRVVEEILGLFSHLPKVMPSSRSLETEQIYRYKLHLRFCDSLTSPLAGLTNIPNAFSDALLLALEEQFLEKALIPALHDTTGSILTRDTLIAKETLQLLSGPLQDAFVSLTVGLQVVPLRDTLCERIMSPDAALATATMRLFDVICGLYHAHATESLMLSHIKTQNVLDRSSSSDVSGRTSGGVMYEEDGSRNTFEPILASFPAGLTHDRVSGASLDSYTLHSRDVIARVATLHAAQGIPADNDRKWVRFDGNRGPFLESLFCKLRRFPLLSLKECLLVTSLISKTLMYPSRPLYECVAHASLESIAMVAAECELRVSQLGMSKEDTKNALDKAYVTLSSLRDFEIDSGKDDVAVFFQKVVVLDEFVRELVAIDSARAVFEIESQK